MNVGKISILIIISVLLGFGIGVGSTVAISRPGIDRLDQELAGYRESLDRARQAATRCENAIDASLGANGTALEKLRRVIETLRTIQTELDGIKAGQ